MIEAMISIKPSYVDAILSGDKTIEIRKKNISLPIGSRLWIYSTLPRGAVVATALINNISTHKPFEIWQKFRDKISISKLDFDEYTVGAKHITAIEITAINELENPVSLEEIRWNIGKFQPPQFFMYIKSSTNIHDLLKSRLNLDQIDLQVA